MSKNKKILIVLVGLGIILLTILVALKFTSDSKVNPQPSIAPLKTELKLLRTEPSGDTVEIHPTDRSTINFVFNADLILNTAKITITPNFPVKIEYATNKQNVISITPSGNENWSIGTTYNFLIESGLQGSKTLPLQNSIDIDITFSEINQDLIISPDDTSGY